MGTTLPILDSPLAHSSDLVALGSNISTPFVVLLQGLDQLEDNSFYVACLLAFGIHSAIFTLLYQKRTSSSSRRAPEEKILLSRFIALNVFFFLQKDRLVKLEKPRKKKPEKLYSKPRKI